MKDKIILYLPNLYPKITGGVEVFNYYLLKQLGCIDVDNNQIIVLTSTKEYINNRNIFQIKDRIFGIRRFGLGALSNFLYYIFSNKISWRQVKVVYIPYTSTFQYSAFAFILMNKIFKVNYVVHHHCGILKKWHCKPLMKLFFKRATAIAGVSQAIITEYTKRTGCEIKYIPPLIPFSTCADSKNELREKNGFAHDAKIILFLGSIKPLKAPETLIKAFVGLGEDYIKQNKLHLLLVGDGELKESLKTKYSHIKEIVFQGKVAPEKVNEYYKISDLYVIPSWYEGTPISLLEAMYNGLICIGTDALGINDMIHDGDNGLLFAIDNHAQLTKIIKKIIADDELAKRLSKNSRAYHDQNYSYTDYLENLKKFMCL